MKEFVMVQRVKAKPMTRQEYNDLRGWIIPEDENPSDEGFLVESEGKPNHPDYEGYLQWLPKEQFESCASSFSRRHENDIHKKTV